MCIIIHKPVGVTLSRDIYEECANCNDDGMGFACAHDGQLEVVKGLFKFDEFYARIKALEQHEMIIHFRIASAGMVINQAMCHPFETDSKTTFQTADNKPAYRFAIVHNGRIEWPVEKDTSDTYSFVKRLLDPMFERDPYFLDQPTGVKLLEKAILPKNKLVIMRWDEEEKVGNVYIINKSAGNEAHGCWFSNMSWKKVEHIAYVFDGEDYGMGKLYESWKDKGKEERSLGREFLDPDADGWKWSRTMNCWFNIKTQKTKDKLPGRKKPPHVEVKDKKKEAEDITIINKCLTHIHSTRDKVCFYQLVRAFSQTNFITDAKFDDFDFGIEIELLRWEVGKLFSSERNEYGLLMSRWNEHEVDKWIVKNLYLVSNRLNVNASKILGTASLLSEHTH